MTQRWTTFFSAAVLVAATAVVGTAQQQSIEEWRARAEAGDAEAQVNLGLMYANGEGVPQDAPKAVRWFRLAADQGDESAQYNLGFMYANGRGVPQDHVEAARLYRLAAEEGYGRALYNLGLLYARGFGVTQDTAQAYMWFNLAATRLTGEDQESALDNRDIAFDQLTPDQRAKAQRLAREWDEAHPR
jgi:TPR repeat protein